MEDCHQYDDHPLQSYHFRKFPPRSITLIATSDIRRFITLVISEPALEILVLTMYGRLDRLPPVVTSLRQVAILRYTDGPL